MGDSKGSKCDSNRCFTVAHVVDPRFRHPWDEIVERALSAATDKREICSWRLDAKRVGDAAQTLIEECPDAAIVPVELQADLYRRVKPVCPVFNADWLFSERNLHSLTRGTDAPRTIFVNTPGGGGAFSCGGRSGIFGFPNSNRFGWSTPTTLIQGAARAVGAKVPGFLGGRTGVAAWAVGLIATAVKELTAIAIKDIQDKAALVERVVKDFDKAMEKINKSVKKLDPPKEGGAGKDTLDEQGRDFLLVIREAMETELVNELWRAMIEGRVRPEEYDTRDEFLNWLRQYNLGEEETRKQLEAGMPLPEDDETGFTFLHWLWTQSAETWVTGSKLMNYLWKRGLPIDPVGPVGKKRSVLYVGGSFDPGERRLSLVVRG